MTTVQPEVTTKPTLRDTLQCKCPNCSKGNLFTHANPYQLKYTLEMPECCPVCGVRFEAEPGFFFGTGYVSYALSVGLTIVSFIISYLLFGISFADNSLYYWIAANALLLILVQPLMMRLSRSIWLLIFRHKLFVPETESSQA